MLSADTVSRGARDARDDVVGAPAGAPLLASHRSSKKTTVSPASATRVRVALLAFLALGVAAAAADRAAAQDPAAPPGPAAANGAAAAWSWLHRIGSDSADRLRLAQLRGAAPTAGFLLRSPSALTPRRDAAAGRAWSLLLPAVTVVQNRAIPLSLNDGPLWAGAGTNVRLSAGVQATIGPVRVVLAPELLYSQNRDFALADTGTFRAPSVPAGRSPYASPWHAPPNSVDLPLRFGDASRTRVHPGQSSVAVAVGALELGAATENAWWGPGLRNALLLSDNAPGFPHLFLRSARPLHTPIGAVELRYLLGGLSESAYFDTVSTNDRRSYSALAATLQPRGADGLTIGVGRAVYAAVDDWSGIAGRALDVFAHVPEADYAAARDSVLGGREQLLTLFSRWVFPESGFEAYAEFARAALPTNVRDLLVSPSHARGHTFGLQWVSDVRDDGARLRLQAEYTNVERSTSRYYRPVGSFYTSPRVAQGYTHEGQALGAAIGPGASSQWLMGDYMKGRWSVGVGMMRIRWNDDAHDERPWPQWLGYEQHDVTRALVLRGSLRGGFGVLSGHIVSGSRLNTFFDDGRQSATDPPYPIPRDESSLSIALTYEPRW